MERGKCPECQQIRGDWEKFQAFMAGYTIGRNDMYGQSNASIEKPVIETKIPWYGRPVMPRRNG